jgi:hypothetical protein
VNPLNPVISFSLADHQAVDPPHAVCRQGKPKPTKAARLSLAPAIKQLPKPPASYIRPICHGLHRGPFVGRSSASDRRILSLAGEPLAEEARRAFRVDDLRFGRIVAS